LLFLVSHSLFLEHINGSSAGARAINLIRV